MTVKKISAGIIGTFSIGILFVIFFMMYGVLLDSPLGQNPQAHEILESGQEATQTAFNWWLVTGAISGIIILGGFIFGIIYAIMKIVENETSIGFGGSYY